MRRGRRRFRRVGFAIVLAAVVGAAVAGLGMRCHVLAAAGVDATLHAGAILLAGFLALAVGFAGRIDRFAGQRPLCQERLPA
jgi:hypothetical protein